MALLLKIDHLLSDAVVAPVNGSPAAGAAQERARSAA